MKKKYPDASIKKKIIGEIIGFHRINDSKACEFVSSITGDNSREVVSFGTEAGLFQEIGISTVVCGPGSIEQAHKVDEFIELNELKKCLIFLNGINSSIAVHNASTQFADGGEFGFGGEIGISTNKLPPRGPVGINQLTSYKYMVTGKGTIRPL